MNSPVFSGMAAGVAVSAAAGTGVWVSGAGKVAVGGGAVVASGSVGVAVAPPPQAIAKARTTINRRSIHCRVLRSTRCHMALTSVPLVSMCIYLGNLLSHSTSGV